MPDWPEERLVNSAVISTYSRDSIGPELKGINAIFSASTIWPVANLAIYVPFEVYDPITIVRMGILNGTVVSGNVDVGIYDAGGVKKVSSGSTAQAGTSAMQFFDITDTLLSPGLYYLALAIDNITGTVDNQGVVAMDVAALGAMQQASAFALPAPATFATFAQTIVPMIAAYLKAVA